MSDKFSVSMNASGAFDEFCEEQCYLYFNSFTYALLAVFGFKFKKSDRLLLFRKHGSMHPINKKAKKPIPVHGINKGERFVDSAYGEFPPGWRNVQFSISICLFKND